MRALTCCERVSHAQGEATRITDDSLLELVVVGPAARGHVRDTDGLVVRVKEDAVDARIGAQVQVALDVHNAVDVRYKRPEVNRRSEM